MRFIYDNITQFLCNNIGIAISLPIAFILLVGIVKNYSAILSKIHKKESLVTELLDIMFYFLIAVAYLLSLISTILIPQYFINNLVQYTDWMYFLVIWTSSTIGWIINYKSLTSLFTTGFEFPTASMWGAVEEVSYSQFPKYVKGGFNWFLFIFSMTLAFHICTKIFLS